jgi:site-specific recombinase XerD
MPNNDVDTVKKEFVKYLDCLGLSPKSHKNYRSDLSHFLEWAILKIRSFGSYVETLTDITPFLSLDLVKEYKSFMVENSSPVKTINRRLSTLRHLSRFLTSSQIIDFSFMDTIENMGVFEKKNQKIDPVIDDFKAHLEAEKNSPNTIKNYLSDVRQFMTWVQSQKI